MKITVLTENTSKNNLPCEHGLSLYIETEDTRLLFDTGQSDLFLKNAEALGIDLSAVEIAVLSHGHYDHGGGLKSFFEVNRYAPVYASKYAFEPHYNGEKYIGLNTALDRSRFIFTDGVTKIKDNLTLYSNNDSKRITEPNAFGLTMLKNGKQAPDNFRHEHYLLIEEKEKRILISGCSHKGIINITEWFKPDVLIGGFHLTKLELGDTLKAYAEKLNSYPTRFYTCHCTGEAQFKFMKKYMDNLEYISTGDILKL